jgi:VanZ family protein
MSVTRTHPLLRSLAVLWAPPVVLMATIFVLSAQPDLNSGLGVWDTIGRKLVHVGEYALLVVLWWRALRTVVPGRRAIAIALAVSLAWSATDEFHQSHVHGRHGTPVDMLIDAVGMTIAAVLLLRARRPDA